MSPFNHPGCTPITQSTHPNYSGMGHKLSYGKVPLHIQDLLEMQELLRDSGDVPETSNPQTSKVNKQKVQQVMVTRGRGIGDRYYQPGRHR